MLKKIILLFGGKSPEHEISIVSARNIYNAIDKSKFDIVLVGISKKGTWYLEEPEAHQNSTFVIGEKGKKIALIPGESKNKLLLLDEGVLLSDIDAVFPITQGPNGEDGTLQGLLCQMDLPFVGPSVLGSAMAMDKDICKRIVQSAGIKTAPWLVVYKHERKKINYKEISEILGSVLFIKPANMGSSIGVSKSTDELSFNRAIEQAFIFDTKILIEKGINGREIECAVLGNEFPEASCVGEVVMNQGIYDFESKYKSADAAQLFIPANNLSEMEVQSIRNTCLLVYKALGLEGMSRVDVFLTPEGEVYLNEPNTLPGFTSISMYPKLWGESGLKYADLIEKLINLAIDRHNRDNKIKRDRI
jgi:D-alanine-D-alanine ligase